VVIDFPGIAGRLGDFATSFRVGQAAFRPNAAIGINTIDDVVQAVLNGNAYVNIHSTTNPGGEIRGQLVRGIRSALRALDGQVGQVGLVGESVIPTRLTCLTLLPVLQWAN
jgi:hypothetical protein